jgi:hypothetical protein
MSDIKQYKNPYYDMYCCPYGYAFYKGNEYLGKIIWRKNTELDGIYIDKDLYF